MSTPLELLFDLTLVVAVSRAAAELAHALAAGHLADAVPHYLMVFFAVWWAWMNFTWFASAYDVDDVPYRLLTLVQMAGVLVLAAGVPAAFEHGDFATVTLGYVIMRLAIVVQWLRAARGDPGHRRTARRYAAGIVVVQLGWALRLLLPPDVGTAVLPVLVLAELGVPLWAERPAMTTWHPHHIAERYGLFTIIVLGECVLAVTAAVAPQADGGLLHADLVLVAGGGLVLLFALWWIYFLTPAAEVLRAERRRSFRWGYGHYGIFAALAALGAGLEVAAERAQGHTETAGTVSTGAVSGGAVSGGAVSDVAVAGAVAVPVAVVLVLIWFLHAPAARNPVREGAATLTGAAVTLAIPAGCLAGLPLPWAVLLTAVPASALCLAATSRPDPSEPPSNP